MNLLSKIGLFFGVILLSNYVVSLIFRYIAQKTKAVHLRFTKSAINVIIDVIAFYSLAQQFEMTKDISKVLLQSGSLILAIALLPRSGAGKCDQRHFAVHVKALQCG